MSGTKLDAASILRLTEAVLKLIDVISTEIEKEADARKRKKFRKAMDKVLADPSNSNIFALRKLLFDI